MADFVKMADQLHPEESSIPRVGSAHQQRLAGIGKEMARGFTGPEVPHVIIGNSVAFWLSASGDFWDQHGGRPTVLYGADGPPSRDVAELTAHWPAVVAWDQSNARLHAETVVLEKMLWELVDAVVEELERQAWPLQSSFSPVGPIARVRSASATITPGFLYSLFYLATKRELARFGVPGFFEMPGEPRQLVIAYFGVEKNHLWAGVQVKEDTPVGGQSIQRTLRAWTGSPEPEPLSSPNLHWDRVPIARCDSVEATSVERVHRALAEQFSRDARVALLCEQWTQLKSLADALRDLSSHIDPIDLWSAACSSCQ